MKIAQTDHWFVFWVEPRERLSDLPHYAMVRDMGQDARAAAISAIEGCEYVPHAVRVGRITGIVDVKL